MNPFSKDNAQPVKGELHDETLENLEAMLIETENKLDEIKLKELPLKEKKDKIRNEFIRRLQAENLKSKKGNYLKFGITTRKTVSIYENEDSWAFAEKQGFILNKIDTKSLEKALDKENLPDWARVTTTHGLTVSKPKTK